MDVGTTIKAIRNEYREYLKKKNPTWAQSTINTHVADAFYLYNNTLVTSFWGTMLTEESMQEAKAIILDYLSNVKNSDNAEVRTDAYFKDLTMLRGFFEEEYGGVEARIGKELNAAQIIFDKARAVYENECTSEEAVEYLVQEVPSFNASSHKGGIALFESMINGEKFYRRGNLDITICFIKGMKDAYGLDKMKNALTATYENIRYFYEVSGNKSIAMRRECQYIADQNGIDLDFIDAIFEGIMPKQSQTDTVLKDAPSINYWIYSPGEQAFKWEECNEKGIMVLGWGGIGDLTAFDSKEEMKVKMKEVFNPSLSYKNAAHATWQFANEMKPGDIVFVKKGLHTIIGRGVVKSDYKFAEEMKDEYKHIREVEWTHKGEWEHPSGKAVTKALTNITSYTDYIEKLNALFDIEMEDNIEEEEPEYPSYTKDDFLDEVYMNESRYDVLVNLLKNKKNIILQGAPGVGKTFAAKRLAYSMMGVKDSSRVIMIQFHQSYSYEDFIEGYRPANTGFELKKGPFYNFCKEAEIDSDKDYFFIIDEINRGNLSKIFGELFMLIEGDKRGVSLQLLYSDEKFSVPSNVHIIGMMNTADRSLAMMDYALRRRFAFFEFPPAFDTTGFIKYRQQKNSDKFNKLIAKIEQLNQAIEKDETLGRGFKIGHSYFCTDKEVDDMWLESVITYEIVPLLSEYWFDEPAKVHDWENMLYEAIK